MRPDQWNTFKHVAKGGHVDRVPLALIVDSPWIPGFAGVDHLDYYLNPETWFRANLRVARGWRKHCLMCAPREHAQNFAGLLTRYRLAASCSPPL